LKGRKITGVEGLHCAMLLLLMRQGIIRIKSLYKFIIVIQRKPFFAKCQYISESKVIIRHMDWYQDRPGGCFFITYGAGF
jgi:hypothetical protein